MFASNKDQRPRDAATTDTSSPSPAPVQSSSARPATPSIISPDLKIVGNMESRGDVQIDGTVDGDINCQSLTIGESAKVSGTIKSSLVRVCGEVKGKISGETVVLTKTARVLGDIANKSLEIESGAQFEGAVKRFDSKVEAKQESVKDEPAKMDGKSAKNGSAALGMSAETSESPAAAH